MDFLAEPKPTAVTRLEVGAVISCLIITSKNQRSAKQKHLSDVIWCPFWVAFDTRLSVVARAICNVVVTDLAAEPNREVVAVETHHRKHAPSLSVRETLAFVDQRLNDRNRTWTRAGTRARAALWLRASLSVPLSASFSFCFYLPLSFFVALSCSLSRAQLLFACLRVIIRTRRPARAATVFDVKFARKLAWAHRVAFAVQSGLLPAPLSFSVFVSVSVLVFVSVVLSALFVFAFHGLVAQR